ncbi:Fimbrial subunit type 1 precursor [Corynebacterium ciconiae DSM 44920]|uniref:SpaH/EbpB family LPXTG-anchored major pilin n=1 Tax=Corynebacterium ciconiae TaxID=227319 RepID=UPI000364C177|nr:SpaH/EbpB family LPXTG-anchored major pilin [Corynebacterium ciconiae]WKD62020.1 Fimbrial subunit type 1 precursor [Corynebacterium ciconiae DSM 44920]
MNKFARSAFAVAASGAIVFGSAGIAAAQDAPCAGGVCDTMQAAKDEGLKLHVHKFENSSPSQRGNGTEISETGSLGAPLDGATFKVEKVEGVDLTTNEGQKKAERIAKGTEQAPSFREIETKVTSSGGQADFELSEIGLYRVTETAAPTGYEATQSEPFFVAVPLTDPDGRDGFLPEVHVYPKNKKQEDVVTKSVTDENAVKAGDKITYTVSGKVPSASSLSSVVLTDLYPDARLETPEVKSVTLGDDTPLTATEDYTVENRSGEVAISLTESGIEKLVAKEGAARQVKATIDFTVRANGQSETDPIKNNAKISTSSSPDGPGTEVEIPEEDRPETFFGNVKINKTNTSGERVEATFDLYRCNSENDLQGDSVISDINVSAADGFTIAGLHVNDYVNGAVGETTPSGYCLVETKAGEGYELLPKPVYFQVKKDGNDTIDLTTVKIENVEANTGFDLPLTGGRGVTMLLVLGGVLIVGGGAYAYYSNRRQNAAS